MHDDFDRDLERRLRRYEASVPGTRPARAGSPPPRRHLGWLVGGVGGAAVVAAALLAIILLRPPNQNVGEASPTPSPLRTGSATETPTEPALEPSPTPAHTASPTPAPTPATTDLTWSRTGSFPIAGGLSTVDQVVRLGDLYVAAGVEFAQELPVFGPPPPHEARLWTSLDGSSWEPVELGPGFENVRLGQLIERAGGSLLALGDRGIPDQDGLLMGDAEAVAWTSNDGVTWTEVDAPFEGTINDVEQGLRGILAVVRPSFDTDAHELWLSSDGVSWERVHSLEASYIDIGAGDEGFTAVGWIGEDDGRPLVLASADGRDWIDGQPAAFSRFLEVGSLGPDWVVVDDPGGTAPTWFSANGLDWVAHGDIPFQTLEFEDGDSCREYRDQTHTAGPWLVTASELTYPCSESGFMVHGTQYLSADGASWVPIPLAEATVGENRSGSRVRDALATQSGLILVGEENGAASFWFGDAP